MKISNSFVTNSSGVNYLITNRMNDPVSIKYILEKLLENSDINRISDGEYNESSKDDYIKKILWLLGEKEVQYQSCVTVSDESDCLLDRLFTCWLPEFYDDEKFILTQLNNSSRMYDGWNKIISYEEYLNRELGDDY